MGSEIRNRLRSYFSGWLSDSCFSSGQALWRVVFPCVLGVSYLLGVNRNSVRQLKYLRNYLRNYWTFQLPPHTRSAKSVLNSTENHLYFFGSFPKASQFQRKSASCINVTQRALFERTWTFTPSEFGTGKPQGEDTWKPKWGPLFWLELRACFLGGWVDLQKSRSFGVPGVCIYIYICIYICI